MESLKLFDIPEVDPAAKSGPRCRNCKHIYRHQYGKMQYCEKQKDKKTSYGHRKVKANSFACPMFETGSSTRDI